MYVVFNADGTGWDYTAHKLWGVIDGVLYLCFTPWHCQTLHDCWLPMEITFVLDGDYLIYTALNIFGIDVVLTRVDYMPEMPPINSPPPIPESLYITNELLGTWHWGGMAWYELNADGTGLMNGMPIIWGTYDGVFFVCTTPHSCDTIEGCPAPQLWYYEFIGGRLRLTSVMQQDVYFYYTRG